MFNRAATRQYELQSNILDYAEAEALELAGALTHFGIDSDDLIYANSRTRRWTGSCPPQLDHLRGEPNDIPFVSFFSGCGGMDLGFEAAGFRHIAAFEINELFCKTLRRNRPNWNVVGPPTSTGDVSDIETTVGRLRQHIEAPFMGVFIGGPPCETFSVAANQRFSKTGENFKRTGFEDQGTGCLLFDYVALIELFQPVCFVIENVPGLRDLDGGEQLCYVIQRLERRGYTVQEPKEINSAHYGIPQYRERLFVVGTRNGTDFEFPQGSDSLVGCGSVLTAIGREAPNHETRTHKLSSVRRYRILDYGQREQLGRVDRLDPAAPSKTVIAGGTGGGGRSHLHPEIPRTLTVRECARLQTFPDDYVFVGSVGRQFTQVGNAVPPMLAAQMAMAIAQSVFGTECPPGSEEPACSRHETDVPQVRMP